MTDFAFSLVILACVGMVSGFLAGLLGVGGGLMIVPAIVWVLESAGYLHNVQHIALGTSLAVMVFTSFASVRAHHKHKAVDWVIVRRMVPAMVLGTLLGSQIAGFIPSRDLKWFFVVYAYAIALQMFYNAKPTGARSLPSNTGLWSVSGLIGVISSFVGIGGGSMSVPFMVWCNVPIQRAIATSAALGWPIAFSGAVGYVVSGWSAPHLPDHSAGFVYLPALATLCLITMTVAPLGAKMAHSLPVAQLKKVFAVLMTLMASQMLWTLLR